jgi:Tol biopolymer transport system component
MLLVYAERNSIRALELQVSAGGELEEADRAKLADVSDVVQLAISPDGGTVAMLRAVDEVDNELIVVGSDGERQRTLITSEELSEDPVEGADADETRRVIGDFQWLADGERIAFSTRTINLAGPGAGENLDLWLASIDGEVVEQFAPGTAGGAFAVSPNDQVVMATSTEIIRVDLDGSDRETVITFPFIVTYSEYIFYPPPMWTADGANAYVAIPSADPIFGEQNADLWRVPAEGDAEPLAEVTGNLLFNDPFWSPSGGRVAYVRQITDPSDPPLQLYVGDGDGEGLAPYGTAAPQMAFGGWNDEATAWLYTSRDESENQKLHVGREGAEPLTLTVPSGLQVVGVRWATAATFVVASGEPGDWQLSAGNVDGAVSELEEFNSESGAFDVWSP